MKRQKGCFGHLSFQKKWEIVKTIAYFGISAAIFLMGFLTTGTRMNLLTVVAVLGCLPASKSAVSAIMYLRAGVCSQDCYRAVEERLRGGLETLLLYDLYLTSYRHNFQLSAAAVKNGSVCAYTEDTRCDLSAGETHIREILMQNGYSDLTVKLYAEFPKFTERISEMAALPEKQKERDRAVAELLMDISL